MLACSCLSSLLLLCVDRLRSEDPLEYFNREVQKRRDEEANLWSTPGDPSHSEREDDRVLYGLIQARSKTRMGSSVCQDWLMLPADAHDEACILSQEGHAHFLPFLQGYRRLSVDIEAMRDTRREVRDKWQTILENLGNGTREMSRDLFPLHVSTLTRICLSRLYGRGRVASKRVCRSVT